MKKQGFLYKIISFTFAILLLFSILIRTSYAESTSDGFTYSISGSTATITGYTGLAGNITIPKIVSNAGIDYTVTNISKAAFQGCSRLTNVTIPDSVTNIGDYAFLNCTNLKDVTIPNSITSINVGVFNGCISLENVTIPDSVTNIGDYAFFNCTNLKEAIITNSMTIINASVFRGCTSLENVIIPNNIKSIGEAAFYGCSRLTNVTIPDSVTNIGASAFSDCTNLKEFTIPNSIISINGALFRGCTSLEKAVIPESIKSIGYEAFRGCINLTNVNIPSGVTNIGAGAFQGCTRLTSVNIPDGITSLNTSVFQDCTRLTSIIIPSSVTSIESCAFQRCCVLTSIDIPNSVTSIGYYAFDGCTLLKSVTLPNSITKISDHMFSGCALTNISIPSTVTIIDDDAFNATNLTSIDIPNSVTSIGQCSFGGCDNLRSITIPSSVTSIGEGAFMRCKNLNEVKFLGNAPTLGRYAFDNCDEGLTIYYLPGKTGFTSNWYGSRYRLAQITLEVASPSSAKAASSGYNSININWGAVSGASGYEVYRSTMYIDGTYTLISSTTATNYSNTGLTTDSTYYYKIRTFKMNGNNKVYSNFTPILSAKPVPSIPISLKATSSSYNSIKVSWGAVAGASGYEIYKAPSILGNYDLISTTTATSCDNTGLTTNSDYYYKVRAYRLVGTVKVYSDYSTVVNTKPIPSIPASLKATTSSYNSIKTSWGAVAGASGYEIYRATSSTGTYSLISTTTATSYDNTGLTTNSNYYYKVRAYRLVGTVKVYSDFSTVVSTKPIPSIPGALKAISSSYNSIKTSWAAVAGASGYEIYRAPNSTGTYSLISTTTATSYDNTGLTTNSVYYYKVRAYRLVGTVKVYSDFSTIVSAKPIPSIPGALKAISSSYNSIKTSWAAVAGASGYEIYRAPSSTGTYSLISTTTATNYNNASLTTNNIYYYKVRAYRLVGNARVYSSFSSTVSAKPIPSTPTNLVAARISSTRSKLTWGGVSGASGYEIYRATSSTGSYSLIKTTPYLYYTNTGLVSGRTYYYKIRAYRTVGTTKVYSNYTNVVYVKL